MDELYSKLSKLRKLIPTKVIDVVINDVCIYIKIDGEDVFFDYFKDYRRATAVITGIIEGIRQVKS